MFGFSFTKLIVLAAIVVAVWYGFKFVGRLDKRRKEQLASSRKASTAEMKDVGDMVKCPKCDAYVTDQGAMNCGRWTCPY